MRRALFFAALMLCGTAGASTFTPEKKICPIGGEKFTVQSLMSISTFGAYPDGMPFGSGYFPIQLPQCPKNGMVLYRDFDAAAVKRLAPVVAGSAYQAARRTETRYYLAYLLAQALDDREQSPWLLLSAWWEAKNADPAGPQAAAYGAAFVDLVATIPADATSMENVALRARAANALRELGRFGAAEALRRSIVIAPKAGGKTEDAAENRAGWATILAALAAPIARADATRQPIDLMGKDWAVRRCVEVEKPLPGEPAPAPLSAFERGYCADPALATDIAAMRAADG